MGETRAANPLVEQFRAGGIPRELKLMAAQGALPLKPADLVDLLHFLLSDADPEVVSAADQMLRAYPVEDFLPVLKDKETPPRLLAWGLLNREERELRAVTLQNHSAPDEAVEAISPRLPEDLAELVVINQVRLLRSTPLLVALEGNPSLSNDQRRRLRELRETFKIGEKLEEPAPPPAPEPPPPEAAAEPPAPLVEGPVPTTDAEAVVHYLSDEERQQSDKVSAVQRLYRLNTAEKVITALKGTREERAILIRDPNRIVSTAVLGSPKITDVEVESISAMKNVSADILRQIGNHKEWAKRYGVIANLARNPRTPLSVALSIVPRLNPRDIRQLVVDRNVPEVIRKQAQRFVRASQEKH